MPTGGPAPLAELFAARRENLIRQVDSASTLTQAVKQIQTEIDAVGGAGMGALDVARAGQLARLLTLAHDATGLLGAASRYDVWMHREPNPDTLADRRRGVSLMTLAQVVLLVLLLFVLLLLAYGEPAATLAFVLAAIYAMLRLITWLQPYVVSGIGLAATPPLRLLMWLTGHRRGDAGSDASPPPEPEVTIRANGVSAARSLDVMFAAIDDLMQPDPRAVGPPLTKTEFPDDVLEFMQALVGDAMSGDAAPQRTLKRCEQAPTMLRRHGYDLRHFAVDRDGSISEDDRDLFEFEPSIDPALRSYRMLTPAIVKEDDVQLRGRVVQPAVRHDEPGNRAE